MPFYRQKHSFTAGELSPLMHDRIDFERFRNGCKTMRNMFCATQGPAIRRPGFKFIYSLNDIGIDLNNPSVRLIPFVFNEAQAYVLIFYTHYLDGPQIVIATTKDNGEDGLVLGSGVACEYDFELRAEYTGAGAYNFTLPAGLTYVDADDGYHLAEDNTRTDFTEVASSPGANQYSVSYTTGDGSTTITVGSGSPAAGGSLAVTLNFTASVIATDEIVTIPLPSTWDIEEFDWAQAGDEVYFAQSVLPPHMLKRHGPSCWSLHSLSFAYQPSEWSDTNGWPERVTFHQQRLAFAANTVRRQTVWLSQAGDFLNFGTSATLVDSDAITFTLASGTQNRIQWMISGKTLNIGTLGNEWTVSGNDQSALTPSNILAQRQTNNGSETNKPLMVGLTTLFVERHGRTVNEFVYDYTYDAYKTSDMAILSSHMTEHYSIRDWTYQQTPDSIIWCVREDGVLLGITYQRQHKVVGWHQHDTQGSFRAITCIPGNTREDDVWVVVKRLVNGTDSYYIEKLSDWFNGTAAVEGKFLDSYVMGEFDPAESSLSGLDHLKGMTVSILADGTVHPDVVVATDGTVALNKAYNAVVVGLSYESELRPHLVDLETSDGSTRGRTQRITKIAIDFYRTLGAVIGRSDQEDGDYEEAIPFRVPGDLMGVQVPLFTGWYVYTFSEGFDRESEYFIKQTQPLPMIVRSVTDEVEVHEI